MEINLVPKFIDEAVSPPARAVGNTLSNLWELGIGNHISLWIKKQETRHHQNLESYKKSIEEKTQSIPQENLVEPPLNVVGPAIEASKYYIDSEELRNMFANLIASSIDKDRIEKVHPSFVEIIKQLSPLDAKILNLFTLNNSYTICEFRIKDKNKQGFKTYMTNVFLELDKISDLNLVSSSINNLNRLGLIQLSYTDHFADERLYEKFELTPQFKALQAQLKNNPVLITSFAHIQKGIIETTQFGKNFISICLS